MSERVLSYRAERHGDRHNDFIAPHEWQGPGWVVLVQRGLASDIDAFEIESPATAATFQPPFLPRPSR